MTYEFNCCICGEKFSSNRYNAKYCGANCRVQGQNENKNNWRNNNPEKATEISKKYYEANKEKRKKYRDANKEKNNNRSKEYYQVNREKCRAYEKKYREEKREKLRAYRNEYVKNRMNTDLNYKIKRNCSIRISKAIQRGNKSASTMKLIGCSISNLMSHLESQFTDGMNWGNYGEWHIDHIIPCASFDLTKDEEQKKCFNYKNLQPLWAEDNLKKSDRLF